MFTFIFVLFVNGYEKRIWKCHVCVPFYGVLFGVKCRRHKNICKALDLVYTDTSLDGVHILQRDVQVHIQWNILFIYMRQRMVYLLWVDDNGRGWKVAFACHWLALETSPLFCDSSLRRLELIHSLMVAYLILVSDCQIVNLTPLLPKIP